MMGFQLESLFCHDGFSARECFAMMGFQLEGLFCYDGFSTSKSFCYDGFSARESVLL